MVMYRIETSLPTAKKVIPAMMTPKYISYSIWSAFRVCGLAIEVMREAEKEFSGKRVAA
jgi:hypothetical protein